MSEVWKDIPGYEDLYRISNLGRVKSLRRYVPCKNGMRVVREKILRLSVHRDGYLKVELRKNAVGEHPMVHRLVALAFIPNPDNKTQVNHIDGVKSNNSVKNLEWCNQSENQLHAYKSGLQEPLKGEQVKTSKLTKENVRQIFKLNSQGAEQYDLAEMFNVNQSTISRILNGKRWSHLKVGEKRSV